MLAGIWDVLIISTPRDTPLFVDFLGDGSDWGMNFQYEIQTEPNGLAEAFLIGESFLNGAPSCLVLGDNIFFGTGLQGLLRDSMQRSHGSTVFAYHVANPERLDAVEFDSDYKVLTIEKNLLNQFRALRLQDCIFLMSKHVTSRMGFSPQVEAS